MVQLTSTRFEIDPFTGQPKQPWWKLGKLAKINLSIDDVMSKRKEQMKIRKDMREKAERQLKET